MKIHMMKITTFLALLEKDASDPSARQLVEDIKKNLCVDDHSYSENSELSYDDQLTIIRMLFSPDLKLAAESSLRAMKNAIEAAFGRVKLRWVLLHDDLIKMLNANDLQEIFENKGEQDLACMEKINQFKRQLLTVDVKTIQEDNQSALQKTRLEINSALTIYLNQNDSISQGGFGKVQKGYESDTSTTIKYGIKTLNKNKLKAAVRETKHLRMLGIHAECGLDKNNVCKIIFEWQQGKPLAEYSSTEIMALSYKTRLTALIALCKQLLILHNENNHMHGDIKSLNIVLDLNAETLSLIDLGSCKKHGSSKKRPVTHAYAINQSQADDFYAMSIVIREFFPEIVNINLIQSANLKNNIIIKAMHELVKHMGDTKFHYMSMDQLYFYCSTLLTHFDDLNMKILRKVIYDTVVRHTSKEYLKSNPYLNIQSIIIHHQLIADYFHSSIKPQLFELSLSQAIELKHILKNLEHHSLLNQKSFQTAFDRIRTTLAAPKRSTIKIDNVNFFGEYHKKITDTNHHFSFFPTEDENHRFEGYQDINRKQLIFKGNVITKLVNDHPVFAYHNSTPAAIKLATKEEIAKRIVKHQRFLGRSAFFYRNDLDVECIVNTSSDFIPVTNYEHKIRVKLSLKQLLTYITSLINELNELHCHHCIQGNVSLENVLINTKKEEMCFSNFRYTHRMVSQKYFHDHTLTVIDFQTEIRQLQTIIEHMLHFYPHTIMIDTDDTKDESLADSLAALVAKEDRPIVTNQNSVDHTNNEAVNYEDVDPDCPANADFTFYSLVIKPLLSTACCSSEHMLRYCRAILNNIDKLDEVLIEKLANEILYTNQDNLTVEDVLRDVQLPKY